MSKTKVPEQKGKIEPNCKTIGHMTHSERVADRVNEMRILRSNQNLDLHEPKK